MADISTKRARIEKLVLDVVRTIDNKKMENYKRYEAMFKIMDDEAFAKWADTMGNDLDDTIQIYQLPFEEMKLAQIKKAADLLNLPLEEYVWYRDKGDKKIRTKTKVPVGYVHIKRVQQMLAKKNHYSMTNDNTDFKTGQVKGESKVAQISSVEGFMLNVIGADRAMEEFYGPRADNQKKKQQMYRAITANGYVSLDDLEDDIDSHTSLNTLNTYMLASGLRSDLITSGLKTHYTMDKDIRNKK